MASSQTSFWGNNAAATIVSAVVSALTATSLTLSGALTGTTATFTGAITGTTATFSSTISGATLHTGTGLIIKDTDGGGCSTVVALNGTLSSYTTACP